MTDNTEVVKGVSTVSQLLMHHDKILQAMEKDENLDVIYLDFAKAYYKVDHCTLIGKLKAMGVSGPLGQWLGSFLLERTQSFKIRNTLSDKETIISGVPQGSLLGPVMFLIFITDIGAK